MNRSSPGRRPRWPSRALAVATVALFTAGALFLARGLRGRGASDVDLRAGGAAGAGATAEPARPAGSDPRLDAWLDPSVDFGPPRETRFGPAKALAYSGAGAPGPGGGGGRRRAPGSGSGDERTARAVREMGPSAAAALRLQASVGRWEGGAFLVRLPPEARSDGRLRLEPGGMLLALAAPHGWDYVGFYFPDGLDLDALLGDPRARPRPDALAPIPSEGVAALEPVLSLDAFADAGPRAGRGPRSVLCRARGEAGDAVDRAAASLEAAGYRTLSREAEAPQDARALSGPAATVWIATPDRRRAGGPVTIMVGPP